MNDDISKKLIAALPEILPRIYPLGKIKGREFEIGDISGMQGDSLRINMRTGLWSDFANPEMKGQVIGLFVARNGSMKEAMEEIVQLLKLPQPIRSKKYKKVENDWDLKISQPVLDYLTQDRGIWIEQIKDSFVRSKGDEIVFVSTDEHGEIACAQYISLKRSPEGKKKVRFAEGPKLCLWGMDSVGDQCQRIIITEGVIDALSFRTQEIDAVSIPGGASSTEWIELSWNFLAKYNEIIICFDSDEPGQKAAQLAAGRIGTHRCRNMRFKAKDANDALLKEESFIEALANCTDFFPKELVVASGIREKIWNEIQAGPQEKTGFPLFGWTGATGPMFRVRPGECTIITGYAGSGKSTMALQHAAYLLAKEGKKVAIASLEVPSATSIIRIISQAVGRFITDRNEFDEIYNSISENLFIYDSIGSAKLTDLLNFFEFTIQRHGVEHVFLDSLMRTDIDIDGDKSRVAEMFQTIIDSCGKTNAHYNIVAHSAKGDDQDFKTIPGMNSVKGIQEVVANVHNVLVLWQNKIKKGTIEGLIRKGQREEAIRRDEEWGDSRIIICKNRIGQHLGKIEAWFDVDSYRFREVYNLNLDRPYITV